MHPAPNVDNAEGIHGDPRQKLDKGTPSITRPVLHPAADRQMRQLSSSMGHTHPAADAVNCIHQQEMPPDWRIQWQMRQTTHINGTHQTDAASSGRCGKLQQSINRKETTGRRCIQQQMRQTTSINRIQKANVASSDTCGRLHPSTGIATRLTPHLAADVANCAPINRKLHQTGAASSGKCCRTASMNRECHQTGAVPSGRCGTTEYINRKQMPDAASSSRCGKHMWQTSYINRKCHQTGAASGGGCGKPHHIQRQMQHTASINRNCHKTGAVSSGRCCMTVFCIRKQKTSAAPSSRLGKPQPST